MGIGIDKGGAGARARRIANAPIFGLTLGVLIGFAGAASAAPALPTGGVVKAGSAVITASSPSYLTINQSSTNAVINWQAFSIAQGGTVQFNNGSGATLNRVTGASISSIDGLLSATGSVYLINPNGVIIGKTGVVNTGGTFVASTQDLSNANFMSGGALTFSGSSNAQVLNLGKIGSLGGDVALIGSTVENDGQIIAAKGDVGLAAGYQVTLADTTQSDGKFQVLVGGAATSATNKGAIEAAEVELRANGGNVLALAGNTASVIEATGVSTDDGKVLLIAEGGAVTATGTIEAKAATGAGGQVETSGARVDFTGLTVKAAQWLIDPTDLTVNAGAANTIDNSLAAGTSVTLQTTASSSSGPGVANSSGSGDIIIAAPISWSTTATLTLDAYHSIAIDAPITVSGAGGVVLTTNDGGTGGDYGFGLTSKGFAGSLSFTGAEGFGQSLTINGQAYTLLYELAEAGSTGPDNGFADIAGIDSAGDGGDYALATDLTGTTTFTSGLVGVGGNHFTGVFTGLGHTITGLTINDTSSNGNDGLFSQQSSGAIRDIGIIGGSVSGTGGDIGGLVGQAAGAITDAYATDAVSGSQLVGGLVGYEFGGSITDAYATGAVSGTAQFYAGGLVGDLAGGSITDAYATGRVSGNVNAGGLVGYQTGTITDAYATGAVSGTVDIGGLVGGGTGSITNAYATGAVSGALNLGGLVGLQNGGSVTNGYWDVLTTGQSSAGAGTGLTTDQMQYGVASLDASFGGGTGGLYPYLANFYPTGVQAVSGFAYTNNGSAAASGADVSAVIGGAAFGSATTGANGYYYIVAPSGSAASGDHLLTYATATSSATLTTATGATVQSGVNLYGSTMTVDTSAATLSAAPSLAQAQTSSVAADGGSAAAATVIDATTGLGLISSSATGFTINEAPTSSLLVKTTAGGITVDAPFSVTGSNDLTLDSYQSIAIDAAITVPATGAISLITNDGGTGGDYSFGLTSRGFLGSLSFTGAEGGGQSLTINGQAYTLLYKLAETGSTGPDTGTDDIAGIDNAGDGGYYALANNLVGTGTTFISALAGSGASTFIGVFTGLGHTITGLTINDTSTSGNDGLFGSGNGDTIRDIGLVGGAVSGGGDSVGGLVGLQQGSITDAYNTGAVSGVGSDVGGLVGNEEGSITDAYATGAVSGASEVGGLAGGGDGSITEAYATGAVSGDNEVGGLVGLTFHDTITDAYATGVVSGIEYVGGLVGLQNVGTFTSVYATGAVSGTSDVGGLVGLQNAASVNDAYWDTQTTGQSGSSGGGTGLTTAQLQSGSASLDASFSGGTGGLYPYLTNFYPTGVQAVSGFAYTNSGTTAASGADVSAVIGGAAFGSATTGANGYYYIVAPTGSAASGDRLLTYATATSSATLTIATGATAQSGVNLYGSTMTVDTSAATLSAAPSLAQAQTSGVAADGGSAAAATVIDATTGLGLISSSATGFTINEAPTSSLLVKTTAGGITVDAPFSVTGSNDLTLDSYQSITIDAAITVPATGAVSLVTNDGGTGGDYGFGLTSTGFLGSLSFTGAEGGGQSLTINGQAYTLLYKLAETGSTGPDTGTDDIAGIDNAGDGGYYALANDVVGTGTAFTTALAGVGANHFSGVFTGLGHIITGLTINDTSSNGADGLFGLQIGGAIRDIGLMGGSVSGAGDEVGGLVGEARGTITDAYASIAVSGNSDVGGLVGYAYGNSISDAYATGVVSGETGAGGLVGGAFGAITDVYATGAVSANVYGGGLVGFQNTGSSITDAYATGAVSGNHYLGGLVGEAYGAINDVYATGAVSGNSVVGGLVGDQSSGALTNGYWDTQTTGQSLSAGGGTGLTTAQMQGGSATLDASFSGGTGGLYPYLTNFYPNGVQAVSGVAYTNAGVTPNASGSAGAVTVGLTVGGAAEGTATTGANGYYYVLLPAGTINTTTGASVLAYTTADNVTGSVNAATLQTGATGSLSGFNLDGGWLVETAGSSIGSLSALDAIYATAAANTPAGSFALTNQQITTAAASFNLDTATSVTGTLALASNGSVTQSAAIDAGALLLGGTGNDLLNNASNQIGVLAANTGAVSVTNAAGLTIGSVTDATGASTVGMTSTGAVSVAASGALTVASGASVSAGSGDDVTLSATGAFTNDAGASAVTVSGGGRWLIYSANPTGDVFGDLNSGATAVWDTAASASVGVAGDRYVFAYQPTLTVTTQNASKTYGTNDSAALQSAYAISGLQLGVSGAYLADSASAVYSGAPTVSSSGSGADANASVVNGGNYGISGAAGTLSTDGYALAFANTGQLTVNPLAVSLSGSQVYNATTTAQGANLIVGNTVSGGAAVSVGGTAVMAGASAGLESLTNLSGLTLSSGDYTLAGGSGAVTVTPEAITITAATNSKTYDSSTSASAAPTVTSGTLYDAGGSTLAESYTTANAGTGLTLTPTASIPDVSNYTVTLASTNTGVITPEAITITAATNSKTYDSTTSASATPTVTSGTLYDANASTLTEAYTTANAGTGLTLAPAASIPDASNYTVTLASASTGVITPEAITITATANAKTYDGTTSATATPVVTSGTLYDLGGSTLSETYASANAGTDLTLTPSALIPDASNYAVTLASINTGTITPAPTRITVYPPPPIVQPGGQGDLQSWTSPLGWAPYQWSYAHDANPPSTAVGSGEAGAPPPDPNCPTKGCNAPAYRNWQVSPQIMFVAGL